MCVVPDGIPVMTNFGVGTTNEKLGSITHSFYCTNIINFIHVFGKVIIPDHILKKTVSIANTFVP